MGDECSENVLAEIEEDFLKKEGGTKLDDADLLDKEIEEFDVVDSWEVDATDDLQSVDEPSLKSGRRSRGSFYTRRRGDKSSRRDSHHDDYRNRKSSYKRPSSRSTSKPRDQRRSPRRLGDVKSDKRHSVEHLREPFQGSSHKSDKLPDLKCTTSVETGEVNVVLLTDDKNTFDTLDEKEALEDDDSRRKDPLLLKNPFAFAKYSQSPEKIRIKELSPKYKAERPRRDSRLFSTRNKDRSSGIVSMYSTNFYDRNNRRRTVSTSPERYISRRSSTDRRSREGGKWCGRSREGSVLSRVSSKSSLSFISSDDMSPRDHDRKRSPLRPTAYLGRSMPMSHAHLPGSENFTSSSEDFDNKLSLLLKEGKRKQSFVGDSSACTLTDYPSATWKPEWPNPSAPQIPSENYSCDTTVKPVYDPNLHQNVYPGFPQDQYNQQAYYNNNQQPAYMSGYPGNVGNAVQPPYNYGNQYPNQYYPQTTAAAVAMPGTYTSPTEMVQFPFHLDQQQPHPVAENVAQCSAVNTSHQPYVICGEQVNYVGIEPQPISNVQESMQGEASQGQHVKDSAEWLKYRKRVPTRTNIPLTSEENLVKEEDPMRTPPPPVISDTWREIESGGKKLSTLLEEANKKREVIARCEDMLQKMLSNDPAMEQFKITQCDNMLHFSVKEEPKPSSESMSRNALKSAKRLARMKRFQSPLLRKKSNPCLKYVPWLPGDDVSNIVVPKICGSYSLDIKPPKSILKNTVPVREECHYCVARRNSMISVSTQTGKPETNEIGVQVEGDWNHYYPDNNYINRNSSYSAWYRG